MELHGHDVVLGQVVTPAQVEHHQVDDPQPGHDQHERQVKEAKARLGKE